jgi:hypothetical protein
MYFNFSTKNMIYYFAITTYMYEFLNFYFRDFYLSFLIVIRFD